MTTVEVQPLVLSSTGAVKMDDRKRPASHEADDPAPPQKRQATSAPNGGAKGNPDDMPGRDELEVRRPSLDQASLPFAPQYISVEAS